MPRLANVRFLHSLRAALACVREPNGHDEESVEGGSTLAAIRYLDRLLVDAPGADVKPGEARSLTAPERDALLAAVHALAFGPKIEGTIRCRGCNEPFDLDFDLEEFAGNARSERRQPSESERREGAFRSARLGGRRFRLPSGEEECAIVGLPQPLAEARLAEACLLDHSDASVPAAALAQAIDEVAPVLDDEVAASCPNCGRAESLRFDIQSFHLAAVERARAALPAEVHLLARNYGWGLNEILALPRSRRRAYVAVVSGEASPSLASWGER